MYGTTLRGLPNHHRISGAAFLRATLTAPRYRMISPDGTYPLLIVDEQDGASFPCEIFDVPRPMWDAKVAAEPPGLIVGEIELVDGTSVTGMLADPAWLAEQVGAEDITRYGGWAAFAAASD